MGGWKSVGSLRLLAMFGLLIIFLHYERMKFQTQLESLIEKHESEKQAIGIETEYHKSAAESHKSDAERHRRVAESHKKLTDELKAKVEQHQAQAGVDASRKSSQASVLQMKMKMRADAADERVQTCRKDVSDLKKRIALIEKDLSDSRKLVGGLKEQLSKKSNTVPAAAVSASGKCLDPVAASHFCTPDVSDNKRWRKIRGTLAVSKMGGADRGNYQVPKTPHWYCDKLRSSLRPYVKPKTTVDDLAVAIFAGEQLYYGQVTAQRDTWLSRVPGHHIFASTADPRIPVGGLKEKYGLKPDYEDLYVTQFTNLYALKELYLKEPNRKWYFNYGCDNYVNLDYMLEMLDQYDHTKDLWIGNYAVAEQIPGWIDLKEYPKNVGNKKYKDKGYEWVLGSTSWIMSNSVAKKFSENVEEFVKKHELDKKRDDSKICYCPDRLSGLILSLLGFKVEVLKRKDSSRWCSYNQDSIVMGDGQYEAGENMVYHFVSPRKMLAADQRAEHETLDRMINAGEPSLIVERFREFIDHHFYVLRRRQMEVKYLALEAGKHKREIRPNYGSPVPWNQYDDIPLDPTVEDEKKMPY